MGINKFIYYGETKFDISGDTVTAETLLDGETAHDKAGNPIVGTATGGDPESEAKSRWFDQFMKSHFTEKPTISVNQPRGGKFKDCDFDDGANFPITSILNGNLFENDVMNGTFTFPRLSRVKDNAFLNAYIDGISGILDLGRVTFVAGLAFAGENANIPSAVIFRSSPTLCKLGSSSVFDIGNFDGPYYLYVPKSMAESYKVATNWVKYADKIRAIEDYPEITGG